MSLNAARPAALAALIIPLGLLAGCESTQDKSAKLEVQGAEIALQRGRPQALKRPKSPYAASSP